MDNRYNGWRNRETWLINVWFNPETKSDIDYIREKIDEDYESLPDYVKDFVYFDAIDWQELSEHVSEDENEDDTEE